MIDILEPDEPFSVAEYLTRAHRIVDEIMQRGKKVLFVGGTPMYLKVLLRGIFGGPPADWEFRKQVEEQVELHGKEALHRQLAMVDPISAHKFHPNDIRRVTRALEDRLSDALHERLTQRFVDRRTSVLLRRLK